MSAEVHSLDYRDEDTLLRGSYYLPEAGAVYDADADRRCWRAVLDFLEEVLA